MKYITSFVALAAVSAGIGSVAAQNTGDVTWFYPGLGSCGQYNNENDLVVAMSQAENSGGRACGRRIRATYNGKWVEAKVVDLCMGCAPKDIDLSLGAFRQIAHPDLGRIKGQWWYI